MSRDEDSWPLLWRLCAWARRKASVRLQALALLGEPVAPADPAAPPHPSHHHGGAWQPARRLLRARARLKASAPLVEPVVLAARAGSPSGTAGMGRRTTSVLQDLAPPPDHPHGRAWQQAASGHSGRGGVGGLAAGSPLWLHKMRSTVPLGIALSVNPVLTRKPCHR